MQQRHEAHDSLDDFPTPPWATRALIQHVIQPEYVEGPENVMFTKTAWEPACNRGYMARPLTEYFARVIATDIHDYGWLGQERVCDFLFEPRPAELHWIFSNPPFRLAAEFIDHCHKLEPDEGFAMLVRTSFLEGVDRYRKLFKVRPPTYVAQFVERVPMVRGRHDPDASTATSYAWLVWWNDRSGTEFKWIPPCRRYLQKPTDA